MMKSRKNRRITLALLLALTLLYACSPGGYRNIDVKEAKALLDGKRGDVFLLDVRTRQEFSAGHLEGAFLIPIDSLDVRMVELMPHKEKEIVVYCAVGGRSSKAANLLLKKGFTKITNMSGGIQAWQQAGYPVVR